MQILKFISVTFIYKFDMYLQDTNSFYVQHKIIQIYHSLIYRQDGNKRLLVEQEQLTLPEHLSSPPVFIGVCVTRSLVYV
jgi:hypothetical protein